MLAIVDSRMPKEAMRALEEHAEVMLFYTKGIVYDAISGHPDIFFCNTPNGLVTASNTPEYFLKKLQNYGVNFSLGKTKLGNTYPQTAHFNAFISKSCFIHNLKISDPIILEFSRGLETINVKQGYTRCNLVEVDGLYITSDNSISRALEALGKAVYYVSPHNILLSGVKHGFFGGCTGSINNTLFLVGSLYHLHKGAELANELEQRGVEIVELYQGPLFDVGSIIFIETK